MRKTTSEKIQKIVERTATTIHCDICGCPGETQYNGTTYEVNWHNPMEPYRKDRTIIELEEIESFPEGGTTEYTFFDICPMCFKDVLIPLMATHGAEPNVKEIEW